MGPDIGTLFNVGAVGIILAWFLLRAENKFDKIEKAINLLTRAVTLLHLKLNHGAAQAEADDIMRDLEGRK